MKIAEALTRFGIRDIHISRSPHTRAYQAFLRRFVPCSAVEYSADKLLADPPKMDAFIVGSDQVWGSRSPIMYLEYASLGARRISYAASANWNKLPAVWWANASSWISKFDAVSVREKQGLQHCRSAGRHDAEQVLDPALLLSKDDYLALIQETNDTADNLGPFVFSYFVGFNEAHQATVLKAKDIAEYGQLDLQLDILQRDGNRPVECSVPTMDPTPTQWLNAFSSSSFILTNSFHGVVFSIIFERPFLVIIRNTRDDVGNERMEDLLASLGLEQRKITQVAFENNSCQEIQALLDQDIQWASVGARLDTLRSASKAFLESALGLQKIET